VPVIFEKDDTGNPYVPTFINSRIYIDLSDDETFEDEYEKLLRNIYEKPASKRPPLGTTPAYLTENEPTTLRTAHKVRAIENALKNERKNFQVFIDDYYTTFIEALKDFEISNEELKPGVHIDEIVLSKIEELKALRNDFVNFLNVVFTYSFEFNIDKFLTFLEKLLEFISTQEANNFPTHTHGYLKIDHYRFFFYELFLYMTAMMIEKERFKELGAVLNNHFVFYNEKSNKTETYSFMYFNHHVESLDKYRNERLQMRRVSITADTIKQRADIPAITFHRLTECDVLLYYIAIMMNEKEDGYFWHRWWPYLTVYSIYQLPILEKLISKRHFEKLKPLFDVNSIDELKQKVDKAIELKADRMQRFYHDFPYINKAFNFETMGKLK
jgi:hypothetical protein